MKAIDPISRGAPTAGQFEMKSRVSVFIDGAGNGHGDTFSEVRHSGGFEECRYNGTGHGCMQNLLEAIFLNKVNKRTNVFAKALYSRQQFKRIRL